MADSLRDQLLKSGLVKEIREEKRVSAPPAKQSGGSGQPYAGKNPRHGGKPQGSGSASGGQRSGSAGSGGSQGRSGNPGGQQARTGPNARPGQNGRPGQSGRGNPNQRSGQTGNPAAGARAQGNQARPPRNATGEMDLAKAYAIRAQTEATERRQAEAEAAELARLRKEKKRKVEELLKGQAKNLADADQVRHFPYGEKIRRVHVDTAQLAALNAGELGVVQQGGRYLIVDKAVIEELRSIAPEFIALMVDPDAPVADDGVPDDLMW